MGKKKVALCLIAMCSAANADTFKFDHTKGHQIQSTKSCASPKATKRLLDFVGKDLRITPGKNQMTVVTDGSTSAADKVVGSVGQWFFTDPSGATLTVIVDVDTFGWCTESLKCSTHAPELHVSIIQRYNGGECFESWRGDGVKL